MENGTQIVGDASVVEEKVGGAEVSEEKAVLGSEELNEPNTEDVILEAIHSQEHLAKSGIEDASEDRDVTISEASRVGIEEVCNGGDEVEKFEEAIGVPVEKDVAVIAEEEKEGGFVGKDLGVEENGKPDREEGVKVISEVVVRGETESKASVAVSENKSRVVIEKDSAEKDYGVSQESLIAVENLGNADASDEFRREAESSKEILTEDSNSPLSEETILSAEEKNRSTEDILVSEVQDVSDENSLVAEDQNFSSGNYFDGPTLKFQGGEDVQLDVKNTEIEYRGPDIIDQKNGTGNADSDHVKDAIEPQVSLVQTEVNALEDLSAEVPSERGEEIPEPMKSLADIQTASEDKEVTSEAVKPPFADKATIEKEVIQASSSESRTESRPEQVRDVHVVLNNGTTNVPEKKEEIPQEITRADNQLAQGHSPLPVKPTNPVPAPSPAKAINPPLFPQKSSKSAPSLTKSSNPAPSPEKSTNNPAPTPASAPNPSPARPAGLGRGAPLLEPVSRLTQQPRVNGSASHAQNQQIDEPVNADSEEYDETREKLQNIRVKFLRLAHRLGQTPHNVVVAQVLYRLGLAEQLRGRNGGRVGAFSFDRASAKAEQLEASGQEPLDFSCTIMVLGKTGVGKSATINSIFDEVKFNTDAFQMGTKKVQDVVGTVQGIKVRVIDTPGLLPSWSDQRHNEKILQSVKQFISKTPPDIVLYLDRLDMQSRDFSDMPLLRTITEIFGPSIWCNAIVVLTHAASAPPDGPNGTASSYDMFVTQRSHVVQQAIRQAAADMRLMNPVSLVENHSACRTNRAGQRVLPNGQVWKPHLLLLSFASKILAEANALLKLQDSPPGKPFTTRSRAPPLPYLLSSLLQSRPQVKLPEEQYGDDDGLEEDLDGSSDSDEESEYDELPPFTPLTKAQVGKLSRAQRKAYFDEIEFREKAFMSKQLKEERRRRKMMKKMAAESKDMPSDYTEEEGEENQPSVPMVPMPDLSLPVSFDSDNPTHRYRCLDSSNRWLVRPVLETHGWDHDVGYEGINVDRMFAVKNKIPLSVSGQVTKDKKDANLQMEVATSLKHGEGKATSFGFDLQTVGKDLAYTLRSETRFSNFRRNKATAGVSVTLLGDALSGGIKVEDKLIANKRFQVVVTGGAMTGRGEVAYGGSLEATLRDRDHPFGRSLSTLGLSVMDWHGDLAVGCNVQSQIPIGRHTNLIARANLNNRGSGQVSVRLNSSEQLQIALVALFPLIRRLLAYPQQLQFGQ